jgi:peptidyl-prolyl cis-trans isomerase C
MVDESRERGGRSPASRSVLVVALALVAALYLGWKVDAQPSGGASSEVAAKVNGTPITTLELNRTFLAHVQVPYSTVQDDPRAKQLLHQILDNLIDRELLLQEAKSSKATVAPQEIDAELQKLVERFPSKEAFEQALSSQNFTVEAVKKDIQDQILRQQVVKKEILDKVNVNPDQFQPFYETNKNKYVEEEQVHARHILIKVPQDTSAADEEKLKKKANDVLKRAKKGEDFAALAKQFSEDGSRESGGDLGFFARGRMVGPFEDAAFTLKPGQISDLVRTQFGYHIIKVEERKPGRSLSYEEAKEQVKEDFTREKTFSRYQEYLASLRSKASIEILLP